MTPTHIQDVHLVSVWSLNKKSLQCTRVHTHKHIHILYKCTCPTNYSRAVKFNLITAILGASASQKKRRKILEVQPQWKSIFANWQKHFPYISNPVSISTFYVTAFLKLDWINRLSSCKHSFLQRNNVKLQTETYLFSKLGQPRGQNPVCE